MIGIDLIPEKLDIASQLGADYVFNASDDSLNANVSTITKRCRADAVIIYAASKSASVINQAMNSAEEKAR